MQTDRPLRQSLLLITGTVAAGLAVRFAHLGQPFVVTKYGGSALWALTIYWIVSTAVSRVSVAAFFSELIATAVEFAKLYHAPALDAFRRTLPGILLLGRIFSWWDIVAYMAAIGVGAFLDSRMAHRT